MGRKSHTWAPLSTTLIVLSMIIKLTVVFPVNLSEEFITKKRNSSHTMTIVSIITIGNDQRILGLFCMSTL